jgi:dienelactone hydrolase
MPATRREFITGAACTALGCLTLPPAGAARADGARRRDVPWLHEVLRKPPDVPAPPRPLAPILLDAGGRRILTLERWRRRREDLERTWLDLLGRLEAERGRAPRLEVAAEDRFDGIVRQLVTYDAEPGERTEAYLLMPERSSGRRPGAVVFHTTTPESIRQPAGLADVPEKHFAVALARRGFVAFCPRNFLWPETTRMALDEATDRVQRRHPRARGMAKMLFDGQVALDILSARPDVDPGRIGCIGHSLGAKEALYLTAFDSRVKAAVSSEGGIGTRMSNWDAGWYLGEIVRQPEFAREHHELLALAAPRPFLLVGGGSADGAASWPWIAAALPVYHLYGIPTRLGLLRHEAGHAVPPDVAPRLVEWLETYV